MPRVVWRRNVAARASPPPTTTHTTNATGLRVTARAVANRQPRVVVSSGRPLSAGAGVAGLARAAGASVAISSGVGSACLGGALGQNSARPNKPRTPGTNVTETRSPMTTRMVTRYAIPAAVSVTSGATGERKCTPTMRAISATVASSTHGRLEVMASPS